MTSRIPFLVVGAGAMGLATTWQLARRGHSVLTLEQFARGHERGASHGATRNFNNAYAEPHYLDLLTRARGEWDELSRQAGTELLGLHGLVTHGDDANVADVFRALGERGERAEVLSARAAAGRWPGMRFDGDVLFSPDAGVVRSAEALRALERSARSHGADIRFEHRVLSLDERADGVVAVIASADERVEVVAETVVITAGAWTPAITPDAVTLPRLTVTEESPAHFAPRTEASWPSFNHLLPRDRFPGNVYGMPTPGEGVKVGFHLVGAVIDPDARTFRPTPERARQLRDYVAEWTPGLDPDSAVPISCTYTSTESEDFVLDRRGRIVVGAGFSGHGFKFTPAVDAVLAEVAADPAARAAKAFRLLA